MPTDEEIGALFRKQMAEHKDADAETLARHMALHLSADAIKGLIAILNQALRLKLRDA